MNVSPRVAGALTRTVLRVALYLGISLLGVNSAHADTVIFNDDFETDKGWLVNPAGTDTATQGIWARAQSVPYDFAGPKQLFARDSAQALFTDGRGSLAYNVNAGVTSVRSPNITLPTLAAGQSLQVVFWHYFSYYVASVDDYFRVSVVGNTVTQVLYEKTATSVNTDALWQQFKGSLNGFAGQTVYFLVEVADDATATSYIEASVDAFSVVKIAGVANAAPIVSMSAPINGDLYQEGEIINFTGTASDSEQGDLNAKIQWLSSRSGLLGFGPQLSISTLPGGRMDHTITASVLDASGELGLASVDIDINSSPIANDDLALTTDTPVAIDVLSNDTDRDNDVLTIIGVTQSANGAVTFTGTGVTYTPNPGFRGTDTFTYSIEDGNGGQVATATVTVTVQEVVFIDDFETEQGWVVNPSLSDTAVEGTWERANPETTEENGKKQLGSTVSGDYDLVTGAVEDRRANRNDIDGGVTSIRSPSIVLPVLATNEYFDFSFWYYLAHKDNSTIDDFFRISVVGSSATVVLYEELGGAENDNADWEKLSAEIETFSGDTVYLLIEAGDLPNDDLVEAAVDDVVILKISPSEIPSVVITSPEDDSGYRAGSNVLFSATALDPQEGDLGTIVQWSSNLDGILGTGAQLNWSALSVGTHIITASVTDSAGYSGMATISVVVSPANVAPVVVNDDAVTPQGIPVTIAVLTNDTDDNGDPLTITAVTQGNKGAVTFTASDVTYTPNTNAVGLDAFTYTVDDGYGGVSSATVTVAVTAETVVFSDDFETDQGWVVNPAATDTANDGQWERNTPQVASANGIKQLLAHSGTMDLVTGYQGGPNYFQASKHDVDGGLTSVRSPTILLPAVQEGESLDLSLWYYFAHMGASTADFFRITLVGAATSQILYEELGGSENDEAVWEQFLVNLNAFAGDSVYFLIEAADNGSSSHIIEAAVDDIEILKTGYPTNTLPVVSISLPADGSVYTEGDSINFSALASDTEDGDISALIQWGSSLDSVLGSGASLTLTTLSVGTHVISASATDSLNGVGSDTVSITVNPFPPSVPGTITGPASDNDGSYTLAWGAATGTVTAYHLERDSGAGWSEIYAGVALTFGDTVTSDGNYNYRVKACNGVSCSAYTASFTVLVDIPVPPTTPGAITVPANDDDGVFDVSWGASLNGVTAYHLERDSGAGWVEIYTGVALSYSETGLTNGTYSYRVNACNTDGCSSYTTAQTTAVYIPLPPTTPGAISGPATDDDGAYGITWGASANDVTAYHLERDSGGGWLEIYTGLALTLNETGLADGVYQYRVNACNGDGCSGYTAVHSVTVHVPVPPGVPGAITGPTVDDDGTFAIAWGVAANEVTAYHLERDSGAGWVEIYAGTALSYGEVGLANGVYLYRVNACNADGCSAFTASYSVTVDIPPPPSVPGPLTGPASDDDGVIELAWGAATGVVVAYHLEIDSGTGWVEIYAGSGLAFTDTGRIDGTYNYRVKACNTGGCSAYTAPLTVGVVIVIGPLTVQHFQYDELGRLKVYSADNASYVGYQYDAAGNRVLVQDDMAILDTDGDGQLNGVDTDDDNDGMPDDWEVQNAFNPLDPGDASQDADGDGATNLSEYLAGTDPLAP